MELSAISKKTIPTLTKEKFAITSVIINVGNVGEFLKQ